MAKGLYGNEVLDTVPRITVAEFLGTFFLVLFGTSAAVAATVGSKIAGAPLDSLSVALAFGLSLVVLVYALAPVSGCHLNPAVTFALAVTKKLEWKYVPAYMGAQIAGAFAASFLVWHFGGMNAYNAAHLGATSPVGSIIYGNVFLIEAIATFFFMLVIMAVATDDRVPVAASGITIGFALTVGILFAGIFTGGGLNPARALAPMILSGQTAGLWAYILGPIIGAVPAAIIYDKYLAKTDPPQPVK